MSATVEGIAASLVREYLSRKGLKQTLATMDEELPRSSESISNRAALARAIHIEKLMKRNKERSGSLKTMIEVVVKYLLEKSGSASSLSTTTTTTTKTTTTATTTPQSTHPPATEEYTSSAGDTSAVNDANTPSQRSHDHSKRRSRDPGSGEKPPIRVEITPKRHSTTSTPPPVADDSGSRQQCSHSLGGAPSMNGALSSLSRNSRGMGSRRHGFKPRSMAEWKSDQQQILVDERPDCEEIVEVKKLGVGAGSTGLEDPDLDESSNRRGYTISREERLGDGGQRSTRNWHSTSSAGVHKANQKELKTTGMNGAQEPGDLLCEDLEDLDLSVGGPADTGSKPFHQQPKVSTGQPITLEMAKGLRELLFGSAKRSSFNMEWRRQNFTFCELPGLEYGLVQHKGGPCGVLACVQTYVLKHLLFTAPTSLHPSSEERNAALASAISDILWKTGGQSRAVVALPPFHAQHSVTIPSRSYTLDQLTERVILHSFTDFATLKEFVAAQSTTFQEDGTCGCVHFLLSALLSKGLPSIRDDMDDKQSSLIGAHGYCTQELVNLLLTGHAVSNVFDGNVNLDSGTTQQHLLKGVPEQSEIGFLSLFEHYDTCIVGSHYKEPVYPLWIVCSESHFTVLFSTEKSLLSNWQLERKFDLFYFDGLANQDEEIRLTIDNIAGKTKDKSKLQEMHKDLTSPLELCIQTKWKNSVVDWNNTEPLL